MAGYTLLPISGVTRLVPREPLHGTPISTHAQCSICCVSCAKLPCVEQLGILALWVMAIVALAGLDAPIQCSARPVCFPQPVPHGVPLATCERGIRELSFSQGVSLRELVAPRVLMLFFDSQ